MNANKRNMFSIAMLILILMFSACTNSRKVSVGNTIDNSRRQNGSPGSKAEVSANSAPAVSTNMPEPSQKVITPVPSPSPENQPIQSRPVQPSPAGVSPEKASQAENLYEQGYQVYNEFKYDEAIKYFDLAIEADPGCYKAYNGKGIALCFKRNYKEGMELISKALEMKPDFPYANFNMAMAYKLQNDYDNALKWFDRAIALDPKDTWSYYGISTIYADRNDAVKAVEYLKKAVDLDPAVKDVAKSQSHFDNMRNNPEFIELVN